MYVHSFNVMKKNIQMQVLHLGLTSYSDTAYMIFVSLTALAGHVFFVFCFSLCESVCHHGRISYWWHLLWRELPQKQLWVFYPVLIYLSVCLYVSGWIFVSGLAFLTSQDTAKKNLRWQLRSKWNVCLQTDLHNHVVITTEQSWVRTWRC